MASGSDSTRGLALTFILDAGNEDAFTAEIHRSLEKSVDLAVFFRYKGMQVSSPGKKLYEALAMGNFAAQLPDPHPIDLSRNVHRHPQRIPTGYDNERELTRGTHPPISALESLRRMRGGSQPHLLRCSDDHCYVVKFPNNPQGIRTLACDFLGTLLATQLGLPTQPARVIEVTEALIRNTTEMVIQLGKGSVPCSPGRCFGSRYPEAQRGKIPLPAPAVDWWNCQNSTSLENVSDVTGILVFDQWTCNTDARQLIFWPTNSGPNWRLSMIDQGCCFNGPHWNFPDHPMWGLSHGLAPYLHEGTLAPFEPWLERLEHGIDRKMLEEAAHSVPMEWYEADQIALEHLIDELDRRRTHVRSAIEWIVRHVPHRFLKKP